MFFILKLQKKQLAVFLILLMIISSAFVTNTDIKNISAETEIPEALSLSVIMYHGLVEDYSYQNQYMIDPDCFESDLKYLSENGFHTIFISELIDYVKNDKSLPENPILLTFDDGYYNNYVYAFPLLKKYDMKAVISPIASTADSAMTEKNKNPLYSQCSWKELSEMQKSGLVEIQNHTYDLHKTNSEYQGAAPIQGESSADYKKRLTQDLTKANDRIFSKLKISPTAFVYPFGAKTSETENIVRELGFQAALDCEQKINKISTEEDLYHLHRFLRPNGITAKSFFENTVGLKNSE